MKKPTFEHYRKLAASALMHECGMSAAGAWEFTGDLEASFMELAENGIPTEEWPGIVFRDAVDYRNSTKS